MDVDDVEVGVDGEKQDRKKDDTDDDETNNGCEERPKVVRRGKRHHDREGDDVISDERNCQDNETDQTETDSGSYAGSQEEEEAEEGDNADRHDRITSRNWKSDHNNQSRRGKRRNVEKSRQTPTGADDDEPLLCSSQKGVVDVTAGSTGCRVKRAAIGRPEQLEHFPLNAGSMRAAVESVPFGEICASRRLPPLLKLVSEGMDIFSLVARFPPTARRGLVVCFLVAGGYCTVRSHVVFNFFVLQHADEACG